MIYDDGTSGIRRLNDTQRLELMRALETEADDVEIDSEISHEVSPPLPVAYTAPAVAASPSGPEKLAALIRRCDLCEEDEIDGAGVFV